MLFLRYDKRIGAEGLIMDFEQRLKDLQNGNFTKKYYCAHCGWVEKTYTESVKEKHIVRGETIEVEGNALFCSACKNRIADIELDNAFIEKAYNKYREQHNLPGLVPFVMNNKK